MTDDDDRVVFMLDYALRDLVDCAVGARDPGAVWWRFLEHLYALGVTGYVETRGWPTCLYACARRTLQEYALYED